MMLLFQFSQILITIQILRKNPNYNVKKRKAEKHSNSEKLKERKQDCLKYEKELISDSETNN